MHIPASFLSLSLLILTPTVLAVNNNVPLPGEDAFDQSNYVYPDGINKRSPEPVNNRVPLPGDDAFDRSNYVYPDGHNKRDANPDSVDNSAEGYRNIAARDQESKRLVKKAKTGGASSGKNGESAATTSSAAAEATGGASTLSAGQGSRMGLVIGGVIVAGVGAGAML